MTEPQVGAEVTPAYEDVFTRYEPVLGLETHAELSTASKMFCGCPTTFGAEPNTQVCPVCLGLPGSLPVANEAAIRFTVLIGLALNCRIADWCRFARKNYFYPDMPKNFQISQYDEPLCVDGFIDFEVEGEAYRAGIERVHLEEDTGKTLHIGGATGRIHGSTYSLVDYNRAGIPLVEIVTKPIVGTGWRAPLVARAYVTELRDLLRTLGASDVRMEQGSLRCDVNVSLREQLAAQLGTRTETKNLNSFRSVERAVRAEILRQASILDTGGKIVQETRHFHEETGETTSGRSKEEATDYRYFPEPDLVPLAPDPAWVEGLRATLPELPAARRRRLAGELGASENDMASMINTGVLDLVIDTVVAGVSPDEARGWWLGYLAGRAKARGVRAVDLPITPQQLARVVAVAREENLSPALARQVVDAVLDTGADPAEIVTERGLRTVSDADTLATAVDAAIAADPEVAAKIRGGKLAAAGVLVGAVMKETRGKADAKLVRELILTRLGQTRGEEGPR